MVKNSFGLHVAKWQTRKWSYNDHVLIKIKWTRCIHNSYIHENALEKSMDHGPGNETSHVLRLDSGFLNTCLNICSWIPCSLFENKESKQKWGFPDNETDMVDESLMNETKSVISNRENKKIQHAIGAFFPRGWQRVITSYNSWST